jgi:hypothetical protein
MTAKRLGWGVVLWAMFAHGLTLRGQPAARNLEYEVKAGFLRHFFSFIDWPAASFAEPGAPFRLCILGPDPFGAQLDEVMRGESVNGHPIRVERARDEVPAACHVLYTAGDLDGQAAILQRVQRRQGLLVVGDSRRLSNTAARWRSSSKASACASTSTCRRCRRAGWSPVPGCCAWRVKSPTAPPRASNHPMTLLRDLPIGRKLVVVGAVRAHWGWSSPR